MSALRLASPVTHSYRGPSVPLPIPVLSPLWHNFLIIPGAPAFKGTEILNFTAVAAHFPGWRCHLIVIYFQVEVAPEIKC